MSLIRSANFDGFYNRITSNGATYISSWKNWAALKKSADKLNLLFIPTVGPGYNELSERPKIGTCRHRLNGEYYGVAWRSAISINAEYVSVASYNDWAAGTQIEEAIPKYGYKNYLPGTPKKYLDLTKYWIEEFARLRHINITKLPSNKW